MRPTFGPILKRRLNHRRVEAGIFIVQISTPLQTFLMRFLFHPLPETQKYQLKQNNCFIPRINLLTLRCFVAEVRWLFPVNRQKKRKPRKQRNTEPLFELNQNTAITEIRATCASVKWPGEHLFCSCFNVAGYLFITFPFMVEIFVCFSSRTNFPF